jgi:hypothetical protein
VEELLARKSRFEVFGKAPGRLTAPTGFISPFNSTETSEEIRGS